MMEKLGDLTVHLIKLNRYPDLILYQLPYSWHSTKIPTFLGRFPWVWRGELRHLWSPCQSLKGARHRSPPPASSPASYTTTTQSWVADPHHLIQIQLFILMRIGNGNADPVGQKCPKKYKKVKKSFKEA